MNGTKGLLTSRTFWGALVAILAGAASVLGYTVTPADQAELVNAVAGIGAVLGGLIAIYGRVTASKKIGP